MEIILVSVERHMKRADGPQQTMGQRPGGILKDKSASGSIAGLGMQETRF